MKINASKMRFMSGLFFLEEQKHGGEDEEG